MAQRWSTLRALALSCHPIPTAGVTVISVGLAALAGLGPATGALLVVAVFTGQLSIGWSNDWIDAARDRAAGRRDKPVAGGSVPLGVVRTAALASAAATTVLSFLLGVPSALAALTLVAAGWAYNLGLKSTVFSWVPYAVGFGALPAAATLALPGHPWPAWWVMAAGAVLGIAAHAANVLPDLKADAATGVTGFFHHLGARATALAGPVLLVVASVLVLFGGGRPDPWKWAVLAVIAGLATAAVSNGIRRPDSRILFAATIALAGIDLLLFAISGSSLH